MLSCGGAGLRLALPGEEHIPGGGEVALAEFAVVAMERKWLCFVQCCTSIYVGLTRGHSAHTQIWAKMNAVYEFSPRPLFSRIAAGNKRIWVPCFRDERRGAALLVPQSHSFRVRER